MWFPSAKTGKAEEEPALEGLGRAQFWTGMDIQEDMQVGSRIVCAIRLRRWTETDLSVSSQQIDSF